MSESSGTRVLIVDDHPVVRSGLAAIVSDQEDLQLVGQAANAGEAISLFKRHYPDVTLVDLSLPDMNGIDLIAALRSMSKSAYFLVLTTRIGGSDIVRALHAGAHAYLFKDTSSEELLAAIRTVAKGGRYTPPAVGRRADELPNGMDLTSRERELLLWLARGLSNREIGEKFGITEETVKTHMKNILGKLGVDTRSQVVAMCLKAGLVHADDI